MTAKSDSRAPSRTYVPAVGPKLRRLLVAVLALFTLLSVNALYLSGITALEWFQQRSYQDYFYQYMFLVHLALGLVIIVPVLVYGAIHIANAHDRPNRRAARAGYALFVTALILLSSGLVLSRGIPVVEVRDPAARQILYWLHVITPLVAGWLFVLHRLAGPRIRWRVGVGITLVAAVVAVLGAYLQSSDPRQWNVQGPSSGEQYFFPSLARTTSGDFIPASSLMNDGYCRECHTDTHESWKNSAHRFASFNNPAYLFSVRNTRRGALERDGSVQAARFCAGCHDPVPFFSGAFDDPAFDDVKHPTAQAGITCTACHAITHINSPRGNADYTIDEPTHYPFAFSDVSALRWLNRFLIKAKPQFHKSTFLKPLHRTPEFCASCHKVHLPEELNHYKWLRGQNHYDSFLLSGVSGHGVSSFYYPPQAEQGCNGCHMPLRQSADFGARAFDDSSELTIHDHQFAAANTALATLVGLPASVNEAHREMLEGSLRVDLFALREGGTIDGELIGPLRPTVPALEPDRDYLLEVVVRTLTLGHLFTEGTADSNEVWLDVTVTQAGEVIGRSGGLDPDDAAVDPWSHFLNAYVLDRDGNRIDRRNAEDIFTKLYSHQIPPGAADVVHYRFNTPAQTSAPVEIEIKLQYRKFDTTYMRHFQGDKFRTNDLPITTIASDRIVLPVGGSATTAAPPDIPTWQRWNDFGIGLLRRVGTGELRQAEHAFTQVERLHGGVGALNLARVNLREGRLDDAVNALQRAAVMQNPAPPWSVSYFSAIANQQNGYFDEAIAQLRALAATAFADARARGFDFSRDYRLLNRLAQALFQRAKLERGESKRTARDELLREAASWHEKALTEDPENAAAHYGLAQIHGLLGQADDAERHRRLHAKYRVDDNARDRAIALARQHSAAANHAANDVVIYDLQRRGARELAPPGKP